MTHKKERKWVGWISYIIMGIVMYYVLRNAINWRIVSEFVELIKYLLQFFVQKELEDPKFTFTQFEVLFSFLAWCYLTYLSGTVLRFGILRLLLKEAVSLAVVYRIFPKLAYPAPDLSDIELRICLTVSLISGMIQQKYDPGAGAEENLHHVTEVIKLFMTNNLFITNDSGASLTPVLVFFLKNQGNLNPRVVICDLDGYEITNLNLQNKVRGIYDLTFTKAIKLAGGRDQYKNGLFAQTMFDDEDYKVFLGVISAGEDYDFGSTYQKIIFTDMAALLGFTLTCFKDGMEEKFLKQGGEGVI